MLDALAPLAGLRAQGPDTSRSPDFCRRRRPTTTALHRRMRPATPAGVDEIIRHTGLHPAQVFMVLLELDLAGRLERHSGGAVSLLVGEM